MKSFLSALLLTSTLSQPTLALSSSEQWEYAKFAELTAQIYCNYKRAYRNASVKERLEITFQYLRDEDFTRKYITRVVSDNEVFELFQPIFIKGVEKTCGF